MFFVFGSFWFVVVATLLFLLLRNLPRQTVVEVRSTVVDVPPPTFWAWYPGTTPPLGLHIRMVGSPIFNPALEKYAQQFYGVPTEQLSVEQDDRAAAYAFAETVIIGWGQEKPYQVAAMAELLLSDPKIGTFLTDLVQRMAA